MRKAVFLDRDGTINLDRGYTYRVEDLEFLPGSVEGIKLLNMSNWLVIVVTNQSGIARGYYTEEDVRTFHNAMNEELEKYGAWIDAFYFCPHHPKEGIGKYRVSCECRKPRPGLILRAAMDFNVNLSCSWVIGDKETDIMAGKAAGCKTLQIGFTIEEKTLIKQNVVYDYDHLVASNLLEAVSIITNFYGK